MSVQMMGSGVLRRRSGVFDWDITAIECAHGVARIEDRSSLTEIVVGDSSVNSDLQHDGFTGVACSSDGAAFVLAWHAPPALLITPHGHRIAPGLPASASSFTSAPMTGSSCCPQRPTRTYRTPSPNSFMAPRTPFRMPTPSSSCRHCSKVSAPVLAP